MWMPGDDRAGARGLDTIYILSCLNMRDFESGTFVATTYNVHAIEAETDASNWSYHVDQSPVTLVPLRIPGEIIRTFDIWELVLETHHRAMMESEPPVANHRAVGCRATDRHEDV